jgi:murein DD-endopeptidase MepM/ murein hydrolase activator NlpD
VLATAVVHGAERLDIVWPTPNPAWAQGKSRRVFLQHAGSGDPESGGFGGVRSGGSQFHEGIDIKCVARDRHGEPTDAIFAALDGVVRYVNPTAGDSSYGRYIVLEHPRAVPEVYTLYAHLARIAPGIRIGQSVQHGQVIATMGHSSGGYTIPRDRAHLHFEIGVAVTREFQSWYDRQKFGSRNQHGMWNGMNLMGIDPLEFLDAWRAHRVDNFAEFFTRMPAVVRVRIATSRVPDFITRYPALLTKPLVAPLGGWDIRCNETGLPFAWTPLTPMEVVGLRVGEPRLADVNATAERRDRSKSLAVQRRGRWTVGKDLDRVLEQLFGLK